MKREDGRLSDSQKEFIRKLKRWGNRVEVCRTSKEALRVIAEHLGRVDLISLIDEDFDSIRNPI